MHLSRPLDALELEGPGGEDPALLAFFWGVGGKEGALILYVSKRPKFQKRYLLIFSMLTPSGPSSSEIDWWR